MVSHQTLNIDSRIKLNNGTQMPVFGLGTWRSEPGVVSHAVEEAIKQGYIHIDCAYAYENHKEVAVGIKNGLKAANKKREDIWITSKLWNTHHEPTRAKQQVQQILSDLQLEYLDQLLIHWPVSWENTGNGKVFPDDVKHDESHSNEQTWRALEELVQQGKLKSIGISNFNEEQMKEFVQFAKIKPAVNQVESHPAFNNIALQKFAAQHDIHIVAYSPLGNVSGDISKSPISDAKIKQIADKHHKSPAQVIIRWHLQSGRIVIPKSVKAERIKENSDVFNFELSADEIQTINGLDQGNAGRQVNPPFYKNKQKVFPSA